MNSLLGWVVALLQLPVDHPNGVASSIPSEQLHWLYNNDSTQFLYNLKDHRAGFFIQLKTGPPFGYGGVTVGNNGKD